MNKLSSPKPKKSSVRHTRAIQRDQTKRPNTAPPDEQIEALLKEVIQPATFAQVAHFHKLGLRERILTLPVMVAFILSLLWRHIASVREGVRVLNEEGLLWTGPMPVSPQAVLQRMRELPPDLFANILDQVLPLMQQRWKKRQRPLPEALAWATQRFSSVLALDSSTLDALSKKVGLLQGTPGNVLAGRMAALLDVASLLPKKVWFEPDSRAHDQTFWEGALLQVDPGMLLLFDLGFVNHALYDRMSQKGIFFVTRVKSNASLKEIRCLAQGPNLRDSLVTLGQGNEWMPGDASPGGDPVRRQVVSLSDQRFGSRSSAFCLCGGPLLAAMAHRRGLFCRQTPARFGLLCLLGRERHCDPVVGDLDPLCGADRPDRCGRRSTPSAFCDDLGGDGLPRSLPFQSSLFSGLGQ